MDTVSVGLVLQQERLRQSLSLGQISEQTCISTRFLQAIESGNFAALPGLVFARNFVRQFALALHLDPVPLLEALPPIDIQAVPPPQPAQFTPSWGTSSLWPNAGTAALWLILASGTAVGAWWYLHRAPDTAGRQSAPAVPAAPPPAHAAAQPGNVSASPETPLATGLTEQPAHSVQLVLTAKETSWVQVIADGKNAFTGVLNARETRSITADSPVRLTAGNAGGLEVSLNGKPLDPLGPSGQVRTVRLTPEGIQSNSSVPQPL